MNKVKYCILLVAMIFIVGLWISAPDESIEITLIETTVLDFALESTEPDAIFVSLTENEILDIFNSYAYADPANREVVGCTVMEESQYDILGVVQYTTEDQEGCQFDFIRQGAPPLKAGLFAVALEGSLEFWEKDSVSCQILDEEGNIHTCTITYYQTEAEQGFRVETKQKEG